MGYMLQTEHRPHSQILGWERQSNCRPPIAPAPSIRVETAFRHLQNRWKMGHTHSGPVCERPKSSNPSIQLNVLGPVECRGRRFGTRKSALGVKQQFCELPIQPNSTGASKNQIQQRSSNCDSTVVAEEAMVSNSSLNGGGYTNETPQMTRSNMDRERMPRTTAESAVAPVSLESEWRAKLNEIG